MQSTAATTQNVWSFSNALQRKSLICQRRSVCICELGFICCAIALAIAGELHIIAHTHTGSILIVDDLQYEEMIQPVISFHLKLYIA